MDVQLHDANKRPNDDDGNKEGSKRPKLGVKARRFFFFLLFFWRINSSELRSFFLQAIRGPSFYPSLKCPSQILARCPVKI